MVEYQFKDVTSLNHGRRRGVFTMNAEGVFWKADGASVSLKQSQVKKLTWVPCGDYAMLHVTASASGGIQKDKGESKKAEDEEDEDEEDEEEKGEGKKSDSNEKEIHERFNGFRRKDADKFKQLAAEHYPDATLEREDLSSVGMNIGKLEIDKKRGMLSMTYEGKNRMEMPLANLKQCVARKNDVELHFEEDDSGAREDEVLIEAKFYIPPGEDGVDLSESWQKRIVAAAGLQKSTGDYIALLPEQVGNFLAPRGRYEIQLREKSFFMSGKTYEYEVFYEEILRMFLLEKPDGQAFAFVISLSKPIQQGQQRHKHLVMSLEARDEEIELNLSREDIKNKYDDKLTNPMAGRLPETIAKMFKFFSGKKVFVPGTFTSHDGAKAIKCALKAANMGLLFPLTKSFLFIHKPATFIRYEDVDYVHFTKHTAAGTASVRTFELEVSVRPVGGEGAQLHTFSGIDKREMRNLFNFLQSRKIKIKDLKKTQAEVEGRTAAQVQAENEMMGGIEEESDDEDFESDDEQHTSDSSDSDISLASDEFAEKEAKRAAKVRERKLKAKLERDASKTSMDVKMEDAEDSDSDAGDSKKRKRDDQSKKKGPAKRDPNAPKAIKTAFSLFSSQRREEIQKENADMSFGELSKQIGAEWKQISEEEREKFEKLHKEDAKRYEEEMKNYTPADGYGSDGMHESYRKKKVKKEPKEVKKPKRDPNAPKLAKSAYQFFSSEKHEEFASENIELGEKSAKISKAWKSLSEEDKAKYNKLHEEDVKRFEDEMKDYSPAGGYDSSGNLEGSKPAKKKKDKAVKEVKKQKRDPDAPKPARSAYIIFSAEQREEILKKDPSLSFAEINKKIGADWRELSDADKEKYKAIQEEETRQYNAALKKYTPPEGYDEKGNLIIVKKEADDAKKGKKKKDGIKPPTSAYNFFAKEQHSIVKDENKDMSFGDISKKIGSMWKELSEDKREKYDKLAEADKERYEREKKVYDAKVKKEAQNDQEEEEEESGSDNDSDSGSGSGSGSGSDSEDEDSEEEKPAAKKKKKQPSTPTKPAAKSSKEKKKRDESEDDDDEDSDSSGSGSGSGESSEEESDSDEDERKRKRQRKK